MMFGILNQYVMTEVTLGELKKFFYNDAMFGLEYQLTTIEN